MALAATRQRSSRRRATFLNDAYGGSAATDRNLYVNAIDLDSQHRNLGVAMYGNGTQHFKFS